MKSFNAAFNENDELYTPPCLVEILVPYISKYHNIWCPFDGEDSEYVRVLRDKYGYTVSHSTLHDPQPVGRSFFSCEYPEFDICISNPPFSLKLSVFKRLFSIGKPFAMLMNLMAINYQEIGELFSQQEIPPQFIIPDKKVSFNGKTSSFCSGYVTWNLLDRTEYVHMGSNNTGKFFVPAAKFSAQLMQEINKEKV